ncbi:MAG: DUF3465 domain-containing protein [Pseudomonadota bacterium]
MTKKLLLSVVVLVLAVLFALSSQTESQRGDNAAISTEVLLEVIQSRQSDAQVVGRGIVTRILPDDTQGSRHQRFVLTLDSGDTLLVAHNIDLAPRIDGLARGDVVAFHGEYEWNERGGVIHWTHHDPGGRHVGGWLQHKGRRYE